MGTSVQGLQSSTYFYSNLHISLATTLFAADTYLVFYRPFDFIYLLFIFFGTLSIYSVHRIIGIRNVRHGIHNERSTYIKKSYSISIILLVLSIPLAGYVLIKGQLWENPFLIVACGISALYVLPVLGGLRFRDIHFVKIFLISFTWAVLCFTIPYSDSEVFSWPILVLKTIEKSLFIFAITLPFDYRDREVDSISKLKTLANTLDVQTLKNISIASIALAMILSCVTAIYNVNISFIITDILIYLLISKLLLDAYKPQKDIYYTGLLDGLPMLFFLGHSLVLVF